MNTQRKNAESERRGPAKFWLRLGLVGSLMVMGGVFGMELAAQPPGALPPVFEPKEPMKPLQQLPPLPGKEAPPQGKPLEPKIGKQPWTVPAPQAVGPYKFHLPALWPPPVVVGGAPRPTAETINKVNRFVKEVVDPEVTLDLVTGRTRLMVLKQVPKRIQISDESVAGYTLLSPTELSLLGKSVGITVLTLWFPDPADAKKQTILTYQVRVVPDPEYRERVDRVFKALADEINHAFPNSNVKLCLLGNKVAVSGNARDIEEATQILRVVRANVPSSIFGPGRGRDTAHIPVDRLKAGREPGEPEQVGLPPPGVENYELEERHALVINLLRINGEQQVMLKVTVAEVNRSAARSIGMNFSLMNNAGVTYFGNNTGSIITGGLTPAGAYTGGLIPSGFGFGIPGSAPSLYNNALTQGAGGFNNLPVALDNGQILLAINALRDLDYAKSLAEPNLVALNGQTATFQAGGEFPVPVVSTYSNYGLQGVNFIPYGVQVSFTPYITDRDRVRLVIAADVSARDLAAGMTYISGAAVPTLSTRNFSTTVELREGQTLAVAGLIQNNLGADASRVPLLGDLPIIGRAFAFDRLTAGEQELVILITPELVHPMNHKEVPALPGSDMFEPSDVEFYLLGRLESHRPYDYRSPIRTDWQRIREYRRMERMYLSGPSGPSDHP